MNKTKLTLAVSGGVIGLAVLGAAVFAWSAYSAKIAAMEGDEEEGTDGLETVIAQAQTLSRKLVYPCAASVKTIESNRTAVAAWQEEAQKLAVRGDRVFEKSTPAAFKTFIVSDAHRLATLPGAVGGALVKPDFAFGPFKDYIAGGKMPADAQLAEFQRKWDDVATVVEILATSGIAELTDVQFKAAEEPKAEPKNARKNKTAARGAKREAQNAKNAPVDHSYVFTFAAKPVAFVKAINALETCERFITVDGFTFTRGKDAIAEALGGDEKKAEAAASTGRRGRRGRRGAAESTPLEKMEDAAAKNGIVTDPVLDGPLTVVLNVTVRDFGSLEEKEVSK